MKNESGKLGERFAADYLQKKGYRVVASNYHSRYGEIDLIVQKEAYTVFVEVKVRSSLSHGLPREAVTRSKRMKIIRTAMQYIGENPQDTQYRFDVIEMITQDQQSFQVLSLVHIENAFDASGL